MRGLIIATTLLTVSASAFLWKSGGTTIALSGASSSMPSAYELMTQAKDLPAQHIQDPF
jgi:hypothetical protein